LRFVERLIGKAAMPLLLSVERVRKAGWGGIALLLEASLVLAAASAILHLLPFRRAIRFGSGGVPDLVDPPIDLRRVERSVERAARIVPWRTVCLQKGVALQWMLRRRGVDARLHYGIGKDERGALRAHVWVTAGQAMLIGSAEAPLYQTVATYPS
jgi:hypothetical protein